MTTAVRRPTTWGDQVFNQSIVSGASLLLDLRGSLIASDTQNSTVTRVILSMSLFQDGFVAVDGRMRASFGAGVASAEAFTLGVTAIPDPDIEGDRPQRGWMWRADYVVMSEIGQRIDSVIRIETDLRSQRKVENGIPYLRLVNTLVEGSSFTVRLTVTIRTLFKLG